MTVVGRVRHALTPWQVPEERDVPIVRCDGPTRSLREVWPELAGRH